MKKIITISLATALCSSLVYAKSDIETELDAQGLEAQQQIQAQKSNMLSQQGVDTLLSTYRNKKQEWDQSSSGVSVDAGAWFIKWDQTSTGADIITNKSDALNVKYTIDDSVAAVATLKANYKLISGKIQYYTTQANAKDNEEISGLNMGFSAIDLIPHVSTEVRVVSADFKGKIEATERSDGSTAAENPSSGTFTTKLDIFDFIAYPFNKYVGFGYRKYKYDFPQDLYLVRNSDDVGISRGLLDVEYDGSFYTLAIDNKRLIDKEINYNGIIYSITAGVGKLEPKAVGFEKWTEDSDAKFVDALLAYSFKRKKKDGFGMGFDLGYRYNRIETDAKKTDGDYSLITQFNSEFHGPYVSFTLNY